MGQSALGSDGSTLVQYVVTFAVIFALLGIIALVVRRFAGRRRGEASEVEDPGERGRPPRLGIVDVYELDKDRNLILLRRDGVEHLLLVGGPNDLVIESGIPRGAGKRADPVLDVIPEPGAERKAEPVRALPPLPESLPAAAEIAPQRRDRPEGDAAPKPDAAKPGAPNPDRSKEAPPAKPGPAAPFVVAPAPGRRVEPPALSTGASGPVASAPATATPASPPKVVPIAETGRISDDILDGVARQLEEALKRPGQDAAPAKASAGPVRLSTLAPGKAPFPLPGPSPDAPSSPVSLAKVPEAPAARPAEPVAQAAQRKDPAPDKPAQAAKATAGKPPENLASSDSVDAIEAEFARLLGRAASR